MKALFPLVTSFVLACAPLLALADEPYDPGKDTTPGTHGANPHGPDPILDPHDENHDPNLPANKDQHQYFDPKDPYGNPK